MRPFLLPLLFPFAVLCLSASFVSAPPDECKTRCSAQKDPGRPTTWIDSVAGAAGVTVSVTWIFFSGECAPVGGCIPIRACSSHLHVTIFAPSNMHIWNLHPIGWTTNCTTYPFPPDLWCERKDGTDLENGSGVAGKWWLFTKDTPCGGSVNNTFDFRSAPNSGDNLVATVTITGACNSCLPAPL